MTASDDIYIWHEPSDEERAATRAQESARFEAELQELALHDVVVHACLYAIRNDLCTERDGLVCAVVTLAKHNAELQKRCVELEMRTPTTFKLKVEP